MVNKQSCSVNNKALFLILLTVTTSLLSMEIDDSNGIPPQTPSITPLVFDHKETVCSPAEESSQEPSNENSSRSQLKDGMLFGATEKEMDDVYEDAPPRVKRFVRHIDNPQLLRQPHNRILILNGPPGTGKSTLVKAVARETGSLLDFITIGEIQGDSRNQTGKNLHKRLHETLK